MEGGKGGHRWGRGSGSHGVRAEVGKEWMEGGKKEEERGIDASSPGEKERTEGGNGARKEGEERDPDQHTWH